jgi:hypothetical protein
VGTLMRPEEQLQRAVVDLLRLYETRGLLVFAHVGNGGWRSKAEAGIFRALGVRAGVPDLLVWLPGGASFAIELKAGKGTLSSAQVVWHSTLTSLGHRVYVCRSVDDVERALRAEGVPAVGKLCA